MSTTAARLAATGAALRRRDVDALMVSVGSDLPYLTGYRAMPLERLTMLVVPASGEPVLVVPELEAPRVVPDRSFHLRPWGESEDPIRIVADLVGGARRIAIGDQTWATFLISLQERLPTARFENAVPIMSEMRIRKDDDEIAALRAAGAAVDEVVASLAGTRFGGKDERHLAREITEMTLESGHGSVEFAIVASGPNGASPHHEAGERVIGAGDAVVVDFGGRMDGYCSDTTRMFVVGEPDPEFVLAYDVLFRAQEAAVQAVAPGVTAASVDRAARDLITSAGYGEWFIHRTGHGIGRDAHEEPYIVEGNDMVLESSMVFSIEPGIYLPGRWGMRIEDIVVATDGGVERLNRSSRDLRFVD
ncbi:MAG: Xaa-Pro peptidase family protein [Actinomycetota bacterium]|nr:Xaa-Pro peptidase family protein [Actinomycetota bacterium]